MIPISHMDHDGLLMASVPDLMDAVETADCVAIITNHHDYDYEAILEQCSTDCGYPQRPG
jgi:hypothetical protein